MTTVLFPAASAKAATTILADDGLPMEPGKQVDWRTPVSWLVLPAGVIVQPGDRIGIQAECETCVARGFEPYEENPADYATEYLICPTCRGSGIRTYGEATVAEVVAVITTRAYWDLESHDPPAIAVIGGAAYYSDPDDGATRISDQFPDGPPQPGDTCIRITDVKAAG